jgi:hypothetical protein
LKKSDQLVKAIRRKHRGLFEFHKHHQLFIRTHNETLFIVAMCACNPDRSTAGINR